MYVGQFSAGGGSVHGSGPQAERPPFSPVIYRRLIQRQEYADGITLTRTTSVSRPEKALSSQKLQYPSNAGTGTVWKVSSMNIRATNFVEIADSGVGMASAAVTRKYYYPTWTANDGRISNTLTAQDSNFESYINTPGSWDAAGPLSNLFEKEQMAQRVRGYANPYLGQEYRSETVGLRRSDRAYGTARGGVEVCQERVREYAGIASVVSGTALYYDGEANVTERYEFGYGSAPAIATEGVAGGGYFRRLCAGQAEVDAARMYARKTVMEYRTAAWAAPAHLLSLVAGRKVYGPGDVDTSPASQATFTYGSGRQGAAPAVGWEEPGTTEYGNVTGVSRLRKDLWVEAGYNEAETAVTDARAYRLQREPGAVHRRDEPGDGVRLRGGVRGGGAGGSVGRVFEESDAAGGGAHEGVDLRLLFWGSRRRSRTWTG